MNREILFRAKRTDNGEWVEGSLITGVFLRGGQDIPYILCPDKADYDCFEDFDEENGIFAVGPETICQYTGLTDKNGEKIWEDDILKGYQYPYLSDGEYNYFAQVVWFDNCPAFGIYTFKNPKSNVRGISEGNIEFMEEWNPDDWEVIGNIFDNPELLEGGD